jgi:hypothetical protein
MTTKETKMYRKKSETYQRTGRRTDPTSTPIVCRNGELSILLRNGHNRIKLTTGVNNTSTKLTMSNICKR